MHKWDSKLTLLFYGEQALITLNAIFQIQSGKE